jgi:hypothetical protein
VLGPAQDGRALLIPVWDSRRTIRGCLTLREWPSRIRGFAEIAQLVEHATENRGVPSSILGLGTENARPFIAPLEMSDFRGLYFLPAGRSLPSSSREMMSPPPAWICNL